MLLFKLWYNINTYLPILNNIFHYYESELHVPGEEGSIEHG